MFSNCKSVEDVIAKIFEIAMDIKLEKHGRNDIVYGYYLELPTRTYEEICQLSQFQRLFYNMQSKCKQRIFGQTNQSDFENLIGEGMWYIYQCLYNVFNGNFERVGERLRCNSLEDVLALVNDDKSVRELCSFCITYVDRCYMSLCKHGSNPDYWYESKLQKHHRIEYVYLDENEDINRYDMIGAEETYESETGDITQHIIDNYFHLLTKKEQLFVQCYLVFDKHQSGGILDMEDRILYTRQENYKYKKSIKKRIEKAMQQNGDDIFER